MSDPTQAHIFQYGSPSNESIAEATKNFTNGRYSRLSFCTTPIEILSLDGKDTVLSHGTGFFWQHGDRDWVVTCWHVMSGKNPFTDQLMSKNGLIPKRIRVSGWKIRSLDGDNIEFKRSNFVYDLPDVAIEALANPTVINGKIVDIVAFPIPPGFAMSYDLNDAAKARYSKFESRLNMLSFDKIETTAGDECVILGYPLRNYTGLFFPIWKSGSLATESNMSLDGSPAFLIDAATSSAMSGSPVLRRSAASVSVEKVTNIVQEHRGYEIIGVYAGRLQNKDLEQIGVGYAWFASLIPAVIEYSKSMWDQVFESIIASNNAQDS